MVGTGILPKQYEVPLSRMLHDILDDDHIQWHPPLIGHYTNFLPLLIWTLLPNLTFYLIVQGFHRTYATGAACQQRTLTPPDTWFCTIWDLQLFSCWDHWHTIIHYTSLWHLSLIWLFTDFDVITEYRFPKSICNGCGMPTGHLVLSNYGTYMGFNVEINLSWTCLVSGLLNFEHPSVLLFCLIFKSR